MISEVFRVFQTQLRTYRVLLGHRLGVANKSEVKRMIRDSAQQPFGKRNALLAIAVGGLIAGALDLTQACILFGAKIPFVIAAGLLGRQALHGGIAIYFLGILLHFFIAFSATAIYYAASRRLVFLKEYPLVCGLFYGAAVEVVMGYIVLPRFTKGGPTSFMT
jgi:hypothetical protein